MVPADGLRARPVLSFVDELLAEQQTLTAVERFAQKHEQHDLPAQAKYYQDLIPLARPQPGEQYAFSVELDKCSGCKACVSACHSLNGLDDGEMWRGVGLLISEPAAENPKPIHQHVTTACHHCVEPGCAEGCPVLAYEKDPVTGIVRHLDDQCIGCQYCVMKCPYEVPKYSAAKGIVRKCDMCHSRLAAGEAPACVQACPTEAIRITVVNRTAVENEYRREINDHSRMTNGKENASISIGHSASVINPFLPGTPEPRITLPTTRYVSSEPLPASARPADAGALRLEPAHWPLIFMLVLTQLAGGLHLLCAILFTAGWREPLPVLARCAMCALLVGLVASVAHLGRPLKAWRAFLGWRKSWMSREIIGFSIYAVMAGLLVCRPDRAVIAWATAVVALLGIACSAMIYVDTQRAAWPARVVFTKFFGAMLALGAAAGAVWAGWLAPGLASSLATLSAGIGIAQFAWESITLLRAKNDPTSDLHRGAKTAFNLLWPVLVSRGILFAFSTIFSVMAVFDVAHHGPLWATVACFAVIATQLLERHTFFATCAGPRMPGGIA
jgi:Fe-S-cluster-containing dehydrogenase component/DMSO reductase anchor subunit